VTPARIAESERITFLAAVQRSSLALDAIGCAIALSLTARGADVVINGRGGQSVSTQVGGRGPREERCAPTRPVTTIEVFVAG
jgi:hypothetical protein